MNQEHENQTADTTIPDTTIPDEVKSELNEIDVTDVSEHAARYELLHQKLQETLSGIDGL
jgi:hypothetical protein